MSEQQEIERNDWDVIVVGGGPAGATVAGLVARQGRSVLLLDREEFPRFRIGESLMPATYWTLKRLGVLDKMRKSAFPKKYSVQFVSKSGKSSTPFYFSEIDDHESSQTWQVDRLDFDLMLFEHAAECGAQVRQRANVRGILFEGERASGVRVELDGGQPRDLTAKVIVDTSGQTGLISRQLGLRSTDPVLRHAACYTRFRGAVRGAGKDEGATLILQTETPKTWFWYIPQPDNVVSVGAVGPIETLVQGRQGGPQQIFDEELARCPALQQRIAQAKQITEAGVLRDFSYISTRIAGDGWVMAGDAFGFLDPIYSTGVFLAMKSAEMAADSILQAFERNDFSGRQLGSHGDEYLTGMEAMRKLVYAYYDENFSIGRFVQRNPDCRDPIVNLLVGNVFRMSPDSLFQSMEQECELPRMRKLAPHSRTVS